MKAKYVTDLNSSQKVSEIFLVVKKNNPTQYKNKTGMWFSIILGDKTGTIQAKFWGKDDESTKQVFDSFSEGDVVQVVGSTSSFNSNWEISMDPINSDRITKLETSNVDVSDFMNKSKRGIEEMISTLRDTVSQIKNQHIKKLLESFVKDEEFVRKKYAMAPAGKNWHHDFIGGLLEHVLSLVEISKTVQKGHPELDLDLLVAGCILHDIGKTEEYKIGLKIDITDYGRLFGHISIGFLMVAEKISSIDGFPEELRQKILHMILSHHRQLEHGSPVTPMFPEAVAFSMIDDTDAKSQHAIQLIEKNDKDWTFEKEPSGNWFMTKSESNNTDF